MTTQPPEKRLQRSRGFVLIEVSAALFSLLILSVLLLKGYATVAAAQSWTVVQGMTDAFIARETALGKRTPFGDVTGAASPWPTEPTTTTQAVTVGLLPGGRTVTATLHRTKVPFAGNLTSDGGTGTVASNPAKMETWQLKSYLSYTIGGRTYVKARTTIRTQ